MRREERFWARILARGSTTKEMVMEAIDKNDTEFILDAIERVGEDLLMYGAIALAFAWLMRRSDRINKAKLVPDLINRKRV